MVWRQPPPPLPFCIINSFTIRGFPKPSATSLAHSSNNIYVAPEKLTNSDTTVLSSSLSFYPSFSVTSNPTISSQDELSRRAQGSSHPIKARFVMINDSLVISKAPLRFRHLYRPAILSGDMANEHVGIALVLISLAAPFSSAFCCPNSVSFSACIAVLYSHLSSYLLYSPHLIDAM